MMSAKRLLDGVHSEIINDEDGAGVRRTFDAGLRALPLVAAVLHDAQVVITLRAGSKFRAEMLQLQALPRQIQLLLSGNRAFGSRDRRLYRELLYTTLRYLPWIEPWLDRDPDRAVKIAAWPAIVVVTPEFQNGATQPCGSITNPCCGS